MTLDEALGAVCAPVDSTLKDEAARVLFAELRRLVPRFSRDPDAADEAVQRVILNLMERSAPPEGEPARSEEQARGFLSMCLRNACADRYRRAKHHFEIDALPPERAERETWLDDAAAPRATPEFDRLDEELARGLLVVGRKRLNGEVLPRVRAAQGPAACATLDLLAEIADGRATRDAAADGPAPGDDPKERRREQNRVAQRVTRIFDAIETATIAVAAEQGWSDHETKAVFVVVGELRLAARVRGPRQPAPEAAS